MLLALALVSVLLIACCPRRRVEIGPVSDRRADASRVGVTRKDGNPVVTSRPVVEIVRDALVAELVRNGHAVGSGERDVQLAPTVEEFRLDEVGGYGGDHFVGRVVIALGVTWILDGLEVTVVGSLGPMLQRDGTLGLSAAEIGWAGSFYVAGAVLAHPLVGSANFTRQVSGSRSNENPTPLLWGFRSLGSGRVRFTHVRTPSAGRTARARSTGPVTAPRNGTSKKYGVGLPE